MLGNTFRYHSGFGNILHAQGVLHMAVVAVGVTALFGQRHINQACMARAFEQGDVAFVIE